MTKIYVTEQKPDHHWRTEIPNIIWDLGLNSIARDLYSFYKKVAGDEGCCFMSSKTIEEILGISENTITKYRRILEQPLDLLGGKPLIVATETIKPTGALDTVHVQIVNIWRENGDNERKKSEDRNKKTTFQIKEEVPQQMRRGTAADEVGVPQQMRRGTAADADKEEQSKKTLIKKDIVLTPPLYADKEKEPIKHPMQPETKKSHTKSATHQSTMRFISKLTAEQRKLHDKLVAYVPELGERLRSEDVCAWFLSKNYTVEQVEKAFKVYRTDKNVKNMGACIVAAIKSGREPLNASFEANRNLAIAASREYKQITVLQKYLTYVFGSEPMDIPFDLPMMTFTQLLQAAKTKLRNQELEMC